jgi:hypothetical protein
VTSDTCNIPLRFQDDWLWEIICQDGRRYCSWIDRVTPLVKHEEADDQHRTRDERPIKNLNQ